MFPFKKRLKKRNRIRYKLEQFLAIFVLSLTAFLFFLTAQKLFSVKSVEIKLTQTECIDKEILKNSLDLYGKNMIFIDSDDIALSLKSKFICIKVVRVSKFLPNKIGINIEGRQAFAKLKRWQTKASDSATISFEQVLLKSADDSGYIIDGDGVIFAQDPYAPLIEIYIPDQVLATGQNVSKLNIGNIKLFINKLANFGILVNRLIMFGNRSLLFDSNPKIFINIEENVNLQLASLHLILSEAKINEESIEFIDLRYDKPIVKIAPKKI